MLRKESFQVLKVLFVSVFLFFLESISAYSQGDCFDFQTIFTYEVQNEGNAEIIAYCSSEKLLIATNSKNNLIDFYELDFDLDNKVQPVKMEGDLNSFFTVTEPTSVVVHPALPVALVTVLGKEKGDKGRLIGIDLRKDTRGTIIVAQPLGIGPDSIAISKDGKYAVVANEAEDDSETPGSVMVININELDLDKTPAENYLPVTKIEGLEDSIKQPLGECEPEFVAIDPESCFAVVSCQENDCLIVVDLLKEPASIVNTINLSFGASPDGVSILDGFKEDYKIQGNLIIVAEEGLEKDKIARTGNSISVYWLDRENPANPPAVMARMDIHPFVCPTEPLKRLDPESVIGVEHDGGKYVFLSVERANEVLCFEITEESNLLFKEKAKVGERPEGLLAIKKEEEVFILSADEGKEKSGSITVMYFNPNSAK